MYVYPSVIIACLLSNQKRSEMLRKSKFTAFSSAIVFRQKSNWQFYRTAILFNFIELPTYSITLTKPHIVFYPNV